MQVKKQQIEPDMEQQTGSKQGKEYIKAVYCHPAYLTYMQSTSCKMLDWMKHKLESRLLGGDFSGGPNAGGPNAGGPGSIPGQGTRSRILQLRPSAAK